LLLLLPMLLLLTLITRKLNAQQPQAPSSTLWQWLVSLNIALHQSSWHATKAATAAAAAVALPETLGQASWSWAALQRPCLHERRSR
jgi:hypothetical protein